MYRRRLTASLSILSLATLLSAGCGGDEPAPRSAAAATSSPPVVSAAPPATVEGLEDEAPPPDASFPASTADDGGEAQPGSTADTGADMLVTGLRLLPQNGYDRLIVDLDTTGVPSWTARYSEASTAAGDPVAVAGDSFLRVGLFTENSSAEPVATVLGRVGRRGRGPLHGFHGRLPGGADRRTRSSRALPHLRTDRSRPDRDRHPAGGLSRARTRNAGQRRQRSVIARPRLASWVRRTVSDRPTTAAGSPSTRRTKGAPSPSRVKAPATAIGSPVAR